MRISMLFLTLWTVLAPLGHPRSGPRIVDASVSIRFPDEIEFHLVASSDVDVVSVVLEFGVDLTSCGADVTHAIPEEFTPAKQIETSWIWNMRRTGSLPPGARLWWRWNIEDANHRELRTDITWLTWIDSDHAWRSLSASGLTLHWYSGSEGFAQELLQSGVAAKSLLEADIGAQPLEEVQLYIYASGEEMRSAVLFEPGWTGGLAFSDHRIVIIGIREADLEWGRRSVAHELAHVIVADVVNPCYGRIPTWLNEGLAVYAEGELDRDSRFTLQEAIDNDLLYSVRSLNDGFTEHAGRAYLAYAQAFSLVNFLIENYGNEAMLQLLGALDAGYQYDRALSDAYGFDLDGLEQRWRAWVGAAPRAPSAHASLGDPTLVPTIQPYAEPPVPMTTTPAAGSKPQSPAASVRLPDDPVSIGLALVLSVSILLLGALLHWQARGRS
jgi:hypothetical protein